MTLKRLAPLLGVLLLVVTATGCKKLKARDQLNKGVTAFRGAQFQQAIEHFKQAVDLDPTLLNARLYLATAYYQLYVPGGESEDNIKIGKQAIAAYEDVLDHNPDAEQQTSALGSIAQIYYNMKDFEKAKELQERLVKLDPNNPDPYGWIGQLDWSVCYPRTMKLRKELNIANPIDPKNPGILPPIPEKRRVELAEQNGPLVEDGIQALTKAVELRPNDATALSYLNLMYRQKAEIESDKAAREEDLNKADELTQKALAAMKQQQAAASAAVH
jgi:tetratricopeptide (TPR) repeat protein